jgi:hypothetical protein
VISLRLSVIVVAILLVFIGFALFFYGTSMTNPRSILSGSYVVVIGIFLAIAGFLMLVSQVFRGRSMLY